MNKNNKAKKVILYSFLFLFLLFSQLIRQGNNLDNYWNFNNSLQISNGLLPYKDINIITTPLFHYILSIFLLIFGKSIVSFYLFCTIFKLFQIIITVKIVKLLFDEEENKPIIFITYILSIFFAFITYFEYNLLAGLLLSCIIYTELKFEESKKINFLIGLLASLAFLSKQSIGVFVILFVLLKPFLFKNNKRMIVYRLIGIFIPIFVFLFYLFFTNTFNDFMSYCFYGLKEFNNRVYAFEFIKIVLKYHIPFEFILFLLVVLCITIKEIYNCIKIKNYDSKNKVIIFYYLAIIPCFYPISDLHHIYPLFITLIPLIVVYINKLLKNKKIHVNKLLKITFTAGFIISSLEPCLLYLYIYNDNVKDLTVLKKDYNSLNGMVVLKKYKKYIDNMKKFEDDLEKDNIETIILNKGAVIVHLAQNKYYKDYDLFMSGNFGKDGEAKLINDIKNRKNAVFLVNIENYYEKNKRYNQIPMDVISYVVNNMSYDYEISIFRVYKRIDN